MSDRPPKETAAERVRALYESEDPKVRDEALRKLDKQFAKLKAQEEEEEDHVELALSVCLQYILDRIEAAFEELEPVINELAPIVNKEIHGQLRATRMHLRRINNCVVEMFDKNDLNLDTKITIPTSTRDEMESFTEDKNMIEEAKTKITSNAFNEEQRRAFEQFLHEEEDPNEEESSFSFDLDS